MVLWEIQSLAVWHSQAVDAVLMITSKAGRVCDSVRLCTDWNSYILVAEMSQQLMS